MDWFKRKRKPGNPNVGEEIDASISASQNKGPVNIEVESIDEPPMNKITLRLLKEAWPKAIDGVSHQRENIRAALQERVYALGLTERIVVLYIDNDDLFLTLMQEVQYRNAIARGLSDILGVTINFQITNIITISFAMDDEKDVPSVTSTSQSLHLIKMNLVDVKAQGLFQKTNLYSLFDPQDGSVYSLPLKTPNLELHWFRVRKNVPPGEYFDAFCLAAPSQASH
ncbi:MAG TPA: hypothetical protein VKR83_17730, partial [Ktedonobacteraceae bacterium]|nr:hypothetical protein [Ktedonobacteraceae bacterium]